ncbi:MAG: glycosyltransferase family protein [Lachnospiraceae bacterium]|nr:glycosyltransferase family protein [Lachnospiraceae bacterium]
MDEHKFCFILCTNNDALLSEAIHYISHLTIPDGYTTELLTVTDARSMTLGYNEAMAASNARYKIYMHQDVFILNKNFLSDVLSIFLSDASIGLIGMTGYESVSANGVMWHGAERIGTPYQRKASYPSLSEYRYSLSEDGYRHAALVDGFMMITSADYPWNTESLTGWDFYDAYQSLTFLLNGHKIVVPTQRHPWCMHDDGGVLHLTDYNRCRKEFMRCYPEFLGKRYSEIEALVSATLP